MFNLEEVIEQAWDIVAAQVGKCFHPYLSFNGVLCDIPSSKVDNIATNLHLEIIEHAYFTLIVPFHKLAWDHLPLIEEHNFSHEKIEIKIFLRWGVIFLENNF